MLVKKSILAYKQPVHWRQAISQSKYKKFSWRNFYIYILTKYTFSYKNYQSFLTDELIIGSNPIITHLILINLYKKNLDNFINTGRKKNVTILIDNDSDYWSYHTFKQEDYLQYLSEKSHMSFKSVNDIFDYCSEVYGENSSLEINLVQNDNMTVHYYFQKKEFIDGYVFHLKDKEITHNDYEKNMPNVIKLENNIKESYWYYLKKKLNKNAFILDYGVKTNNKDNELKTSILLTKNVYITSFINGWLPSEKEQIEMEVEGVKCSVTKFTNEFENSYGSAKMIGDDFINFKMLSLSQILQLLNGQT